MNKEILLIIDTVSNEKNVSKEVIIDAIEHALASSVKKKYRLDRKCEFDIDARVSIDLESGEYTTYRKWQVVEEIEEEMGDQQILIEEAKIPRSIFSAKYEFISISLQNLISIFLEASHFSNCLRSDA